MKLRKEIRAHQKRFKKAIQIVHSNEYKTLKHMEKRITELQEKSRRETERYLDGKISQAYHQNDIRTLTKLISSYQDDKPAPPDTPITCAKDEQQNVRTGTKNTQEAFRNFWTKIFSNEQHKTDLENFDIDRYACGDCPNIFNSQITKEEVEHALKTISPNKATGLDDIAPAFLYM